MSTQSCVNHGPHPVLCEVPGLGQEFFDRPQNEGVTMNQDHINASELAWRAGINRRRAKSATWQSGASFRDNGARVMTEREGEKIVARQRFAQRVAKRHDRHLEQIADNEAPRRGRDFRQDGGPVMASAQKKPFDPTVLFVQLHHWVMDTPDFGA
jgi:hypothetical protein